MLKSESINWNDLNKENIAVILWEEELVYFLALMMKVSHEIILQSQCTSPHSRDVSNN